MKRDQRLRTPADFRRAREQAPRGWPHPLLVLYVVSNELGRTRIGITVSSRVGNAVVRNRVCTSCRMQVPIGVVATLMRGTVTQVCGNCGLYLCLPDTPETPVVEAPVVAKPVRKARKPRALVQQV